MGGIRFADLFGGLKVAGKNGKIAEKGINMAKNTVYPLIPIFSTSQKIFSTNQTVLARKYVCKA